MTLAPGFLIVPGTWAADHYDGRIKRFEAGSCACITTGCKTQILTSEWRDMHGDMIRLRREIARHKDERALVIVGEIANIIARGQVERVESCPMSFTGRGSELSFL